MPNVTEEKCRETWRSKQAHLGLHVERAAEALGGLIVVLHGEGHLCILEVLLGRQLQGRREVRQWGSEASLGRVGGGAWAADAALGSQAGGMRSEKATAGQCMLMTTRARPLLHACSAGLQKQAGRHATPSAWRRRRRTCCGGRAGFFLPDLDLGLGTPMAPAAAGRGCGELWVGQGARLQRRRATMHATAAAVPHARGPHLLRARAGGRLLGGVLGLEGRAARRAAGDGRARAVRKYGGAEL